MNTAAWDVHTARLFGRCESGTGIAPFCRLIDQVMRQAPYRDARRIFWIVDNGSSHRGRASLERMHRLYPRSRLVHGPIHASWLNQIEIYFSIIQRKVLTPQMILPRCRPLPSNFTISNAITSNGLDLFSGSSLVKTSMASLSGLTKPPNNT